MSIRPASHGDPAEPGVLHSDDSLAKFVQAAGAEAKGAFNAVLADANDMLAVGGDAAALVPSVLPGPSRYGAWRTRIETKRMARAWRGRGMNAHLLDRAIVAVRSQGCRSVRPTSDRCRPDTHPFHAGAGFEQTHPRFKLMLNTQ